ncbi:hypothetical protein, partial [Pseudomonas aeruginosa]
TALRAGAWAATAVLAAHGSGGFARSLPAIAPADPIGARALRAACAGKEDFSDPAPPVRVFGNVWYVGTCNVSAVLVT